MQAKRGLTKGRKLWESLLSLAHGLDEDPSLRCALLVDYAASRPVRQELRRDIERLAQGRDDRLKPITKEFLGRLEADGIEPKRSLLARLSVIVADLGDRSEGEGTALELLSRVVDKASILNAWTAFRDDGMHLAEIAGRQEASSLRNLLEKHEIRFVAREELPLLQREDHIPSNPQPFVGRNTVVNEIRGLLSTIKEGQGPFVVVQGLPGSGKTAVATVVANGLRSTFPGEILWASIGPNPNQLSILADWGRSLGAEDLVGYKDVGAASARMKALLRNRRVLFALDDVWAAEDVQPLTVGGPESAILATTRSRQAARSMAPSGTMLEIGPLSEAEAVSLLEELVPSINEADCGLLSELATKLGCLPLALKVAGRLLEEEATLGLGVADLLSEIKEGETLLAADVPPDLVDLVESTTPTVTALLGRSTDKLGDNERERFGRLGVFEPGPASFDLSAVGAMWDETNEQDIKATLSTLIGRGLVDPNGSGRFSLHPVLKMQANFLLGRASDDSLATYYLHATHYLELLRSANALYRSGGEASKVGLALFDTEWENVRSGQYFAASRLAEDSEDAEAARLVSGYADAGWELLSLRASLDERARWLENALHGDKLLIEANSLSEETGEGWDEALRNYRTAQASHLHMLAMVRYHAGQTENAFTLERESRKIWRSLGNRRGESRTLNILGALHAISGDYPLAERSYLKAIELLDKEADDPEAPAHPPKSHDRDRAAILGNLTNLYRRRRKAALANKASNEAIAIFRALGDMIQVGIALNNRGAIRSELEDDVLGAVKAFLTARRIFRYLGSRSDEAHSLLALGREDADAGNYQPAENKAREVIAVCKELGTHFQKGAALVVLGEARLGLGYSDEAEDFYQEALDIASEAQDTRLETEAREGLEKVAHTRENT